MLLCKESILDYQHSIPSPLCRIMIESLYPHITNQQVISMPCIANQSQSHRARLVPSWPSIPLEVLMFESGIKSFRTPAYVHRLLSREEWRGRPEVQAAIDSERDGLLLEGTWREDEILAKDVVVESARLKGETIHLASLMTIVSIKGFEKNPDEWRIKARVVFRGDAVKDQDGLGAIFQDLSASAPFEHSDHIQHDAWKPLYNQRLYQGLHPKSFEDKTPDICITSPGTRSTVKETFEVSMRTTA